MEWTKNNLVAASLRAVLTCIGFSPLFLISTQWIRMACQEPLFEQCPYFHMEGNEEAEKEENV